MFTFLPKHGDEKCLCGSSKYLKCSRQELFMLEERAVRDESVKARRKSSVKQFMFLSFCSHVLYIINAAVAASAKWGTIKLKVISFRLNDRTMWATEKGYFLTLVSELASRNTVCGLIMGAKKFAFSCLLGLTFMCDVWHLYNLSSTTRQRESFFNEHIMTFIERTKLAPFHIVVCKVRFHYQSGKNFN